MACGPRPTGGGGAAAGAAMAFSNARPCILRAAMSARILAPRSSSSCNCRNTSRYSARSRLSMSPLRSCVRTSSSSSLTNLAYRSASRIRSSDGRVSTSSGDMAVMSWTVRESTSIKSSMSPNATSTRPAMMAASGLARLGSDVPVVRRISLSPRGRWRQSGTRTRRKYLPPRRMR